MVQTSNVKRFLSAVASAEDRGAREAGWIAAIGEPGLGKTRTLEWWAANRGAAFLRAKAEWRSHWVMQELALALGISAEGSYKTLFGRIIEQIGTRGVPIVIDEAEKTRHNMRLLDGIRDIVDLTEVELIIGGTPDALRFLTKYPQWASRVCATARFGLLTHADVRLMADQLCEVPVADDVIPILHDQAGGYAREIKNGLGEIERVGRVNPGVTVTADMLADRDLCRNRRALDGAQGRRR